MLNIDVVENIGHILTGGILIYAGFGQRDEGVARSVAGAPGVIYVLVGLLGFVLPYLLGLIPSSYTVADNMVYLALGALGLAVAFLAEGTVPRRGGHRGRGLTIPKEEAHEAIFPTHVYQSSGQPGEQNSQPCIRATFTSRKEKAWA